MDSASNSPSTQMRNNSTFLYQWTISKLEERRANRLAEKSTQAQTA